MTKRRGFRFGLKALLIVVFVLAAGFAYVRNAEWLVEQRAVTWSATSLATASDESLHPVTSLIVLRGSWHRLLGWRDLAVVFYAPDNWAPYTHPASGEIEKSVADAFQFHSTKWVGQVTRIDDVRSACQGEPVASIDAFAADMNVSKWTEAEFWSWIDRRREGAE